MLGELVNGVKMAFTGIRYPQLIGFVEDVMNFALWFQEVFRFDKADFDEVKEYIQRKFEELEAGINEEEKERIKAELEATEDEEVRRELEKKLKELEERENEELRKAFGDIVLKVMKKAGKYIKASKYDEERNVLKVVLQDKEKKKLVLVITAKVVE